VCVCVNFHVWCFLILVRFGVKIRIAIQYMDGHLQFLIFVQLMPPISFISWNSRPRFTLVIKSLAPYPEISFYCKRKETVLRREHEKVSGSIERISVQDNERRKIYVTLTRL